MNATLVCNPYAGRRSGQAELSKAIEILRSAAWKVDVESTSRPGDATRIARAAAESGQDAVVVAGGDGTINEAIQALGGTETALGYLPYGTVNVWARELGIPLRASLAAGALLDSKRTPIDLGVANSRRFLLMASLGFDGLVLRRAQRWERHKPRYGILPYVASGLTVAPLYRGVDFELRYDSLIRRVQALMIVIGNTRLYGGRFRLTPDAFANDGWLDVCIIKGHGALALARQSLPVLLSGSLRYSDVERMRVKQIAIRSDQEAPLQLDGELFGGTPAVFGVEPLSLHILAPNGVEHDVVA
jgi:diacylglycerol kinase (ATP)